MSRVRFKSCIVWSLSATTILVFGTFITALITSSSRSIPGVVAVEVIDGTEESSVSLSFGIGLFLLVVVLALAAAAINVAITRDDQTT